MTDDGEKVILPTRLAFKKKETESINQLTRLFLINI